MGFNSLKARVRSAFARSVPPAARDLTIEGILITATELPEG